jgi:tyrosinase
VAAFDPIFFLHHAQVDRLLSLWAALNPGVWVSPSTSENGTFTTRADTPVNKDSGKSITVIEISKSILTAE